MYKPIDFCKEYKPVLLERTHILYSKLNYTPRHPSVVNTWVRLSFLLGEPLWGQNALYTHKLNYLTL